MRAALIPILLACLVTLMCGCKAPVKKTADGNIIPQTAKGKSGGRTRMLSLYSALDPNETKIYLSAYSEKVAAEGDRLEIKLNRMSSGEVFARISAEKNRPTMGLWFGGSSTDFVAAADAGLLTAYHPKINYDPLAETHDPRWRWTGFYFGVIGFAVNNERIKLLGVPPPRNWDDLLRPEFRGEIGVAYPYTSGTAYTILSSLVQLMGEKRAFEYMGRLDRNVHHYTKSGAASVTQAGLGEITVGIAFSHDVLSKGISKGYPLTLCLPEDGAGFEIGAMALIQNGPDQDEAKRFVDWMLSTEAQNLMKKWFRIPLNPHAEVAAGAVTADSVRLIPDNAQWAGKNKIRLIEQWRLITAQ